MKKFNLTLKEKKQFLGMVEGGRISVGAQTDPEPEWCIKLENDLCEKFSSKYAVTFNSGTSSIHAALCAAGVREGDEVICSPLNCYSVVLPIAMLGGIVVFCDIDPSTLSISLESLKKCVTSKTKAVLLPYIYGLTMNIEKFVSFCKSKEICLIEDCAHVPGLAVGNKIAGTFGDIGCFSFAQSKLVDCGEGGAAITNNENYFNEMLSFKESGKKAFRVYIPHGANNKMNNISGFLAQKHLSLLEKNISLRRKIANLYFSECKSKNIKPINNRSDCFPSVALFYSNILSREKIVELRNAGIDAKRIYQPLNESNVFTERALTLDFFNNNQSRFDAFVRLNKSTPLAHDAITHFFYIETDPLVSLSEHKKKAKIFGSILG